MVAPRSRFTRSYGISMAPSYPTKPSGISFTSRTAWSGALTSGRTIQLIRNFAKGLADRQHGVADQARILDRSLPMFHRLAINRIADHFGEGGDGRIFGDEAMVPALGLGSDQHQFEPALPDDFAAEPLEHRPAFPAIGRIGFRAAGLAAIGIGGHRPQ